MLNQKERPDTDGFEKREISTKWEVAETGRMTYRLDFDAKGRTDESLCLWHCEASGKVTQVVFLTPSEMDVAFDDMDTQGRMMFQRSGSIYWGVFLLTMFFTMRDAVAWNVDCVLVEHHGGEDFVSCSVEIYRDREAFEVQTDPD